MARNTLMFINLSGNEKHTDSSVNKVVRSHVMRECKRQKRDKQRRKPSAATSIFRHDKFNLRFTNGRNFDKRNARNAEEYEKGLVVSGEVGAEMELGSYPTSQHNSTLNGQVQDYSTSTTTCETFLQFPFTQLNGMVDPFNVLPIPSSPRVMMLLHHSSAATIRTSVHADPTGRFDGYRAGDAAWLYMTMSFAAERLRHPKDTDDLESTKYLSKSISIINEYLADPSMRASDSTIATVACLANIEHLNGTTEKGLIHINGLRTMIELRGGLHNLGFRGIIRRMVLWADLCSSTRARSAPRFPQVHFQLESLIHFYPPCSRTQYIFWPSEPLIKAGEQHKRTIVLDQLQHLHELSTFLNLLTADEEELPVEAAYPDRVYSVEHSLLTDIAKQRDGEEVGIFEVLQNAALLFIYSNLRQTPVGGMIRKSILGRLTVALEAVELSTLVEGFPAEMLWVFFLAVLGAGDGTLEQGWYAGNANGVCEERGLESWEDVMGFLGSMPTLEKACVARCKRMWENSIVM